MSLNLLDIIDRLPIELQARLESDEFFADVPVVVAEEGNIAAMLAAKQAVITEKGGKRGIAVVILQVVAEDRYPELAYGPMALRPAIQVVENVEMNRGSGGTGKSARRVARRVALVIKSCSLAGIVTDFVLDKPGIEPVSVEELGSAIHGYQVNFVCLEADTEVVSQVDEPVIAAVQGGETPQITMSCGTAGAAIYYTTDDSAPGAGRVGSVLYAGAIDIPADGFTVRACAFKTGMVASKVVRSTVTVES